MNERRQKGETSEPTFSREANQVTRSVVMEFLGSVRSIQKELVGRKRARRQDRNSLHEVTNGKTVPVEVEWLQDLYSKATQIVSAEKKKYFDLKIVQASRHALMLAGAVSSITLAGFAGEGVRNEIKESKGSNGDVVFTHSDIETTQILDYLTGKSPLPEAERLRLLRAYLRQGYEVENLKAPTNLDSLDESGLKEAVYVYYKTVGKESEEDAREGAEGFVSDGVPEYEFNPKLYRKLWRLQREVGAPRIRWAFDGGFDARMVGSERANYNGLSNTAYIYPLTAFNDLISEDAHAHQREHSPWQTSLRWVYDGAATLMRAVVTKTDLRVAYSDDYRTPRSLEHIAHTEIEPNLRESLDGEYPTRKRGDTNAE
ncbi:hypothetical protein EPO56_03770 [Patescibacteria group bacterium]|nr:MAG: hypothetical protein EPO56_03770 [Patescibacteria group bacterium]